MNLQNQGKQVSELLKKQYPNAKSELNYSNTMELAIAVCLSAQTTDKKVNEVTAKLFKNYKTWDDYANANLQDVIEVIKGVNFHKGKAERLIKLANTVINKFDSELPKTIAQLITLPGVARKTANVILSEGFGIAEGIVVDTHVLRVSNRLGLATSDKPLKVEQELLKVIPKENWLNINNSMVLHGRYVCKARNPNCEACTLNKICPSAFNF